MSHFKFYRLQKTNDVKSFVNCWSDLYSYGLEKLYSENIGKPLTRERLMALFSWKNGIGNIAKKKKSSILKNYYFPFLKKKPMLHSVQCGRCHLEGLGGGPIWGIFWLHCNKPKLYPLFDQHTYRAMRYIQTGEIKELPKKKRELLNIYFEEYIPFFQDSLKNKIGWGKMQSKKKDEALFTFGRFAKLFFA